MKGLVKSIKLLSQMFVYNKEHEHEHEMEIGFPTDVQHVSHIGWDGQNGNNPSWMTDFKASSDFSSDRFADSRDTSWASQDFDQPKDIPSFGIFSEATCPPDIPKAPKKIKKKKTKPPTSPSSSTSARSSRSSKSRASFATAFEDFDQERKNIRIA